MTIPKTIKLSHQFSLAALALLACMAPASVAQPTADDVAGPLKKLSGQTPEQLWRDGGATAVKGIVDLIDAAGPGADFQARLALHGLAVHLGRPGQDDDRRKLVEALAATLDGERKATTKAIVIRELQHARGREAAAAIGKLLLDPELCEYATLALASFTDSPAAAAELRRALPQAKGRTRATILGGLGAIRDSASAEAFRKALGDADRDTRLVAAKALAELGDTAACAPLLKAATGADSIVEKGLMGAACLRLAGRLVEQGKPADAEQFLLQLWKAPPDPANVNLRCGTLYELGRTGGKEASKVLAEIARGDNARLARAALRGMAGQAGRELTWFASLADAKEPVRAMFIEEVASSGSPALPAVVLTGLKSPSIAIKTAALKAVRGDTGAEVIAAVVPLLGHEDKGLITAANAALCRIPGKGPDAVLVAALTGATPQAARETFAVLAARLAREQVPAVVAGLASQESGVRQAALQALGALGTDMHLPLLIEKVASAGSDEERKAAGNAVVTLTRRSPTRPKMLAAILTAQEAAKGPARAELLRDLGQFSEPSCLAVVTKSLDDADPAVRAAAVQALSDWPEPSAVETLRRVIKDSREPAHRSLALRGLIRLLPAVNQARVKDELAKNEPLTKEKAQAAYTAAYTAAMLADYKTAMAAAEQPNERKLILQAIRNFPHATSLSLAKTALADSDLVVRGEAEETILKLAASLSDSPTTRPQVIAGLEEIVASSQSPDRTKRGKELLGKLAAKR